MLDRRRVRLCATIAVVLGPCTVHSNTDPMVLDTMVITGTRTERKLLDVPVRTEVINREALESSHARDLSEALQHQPGLLLKDIHGKSGKEVWLQGLDSDRVLILIDGKPVSASSGSTVDLTQIAIADVDRIEIVKGAVSALYGSAAMGGVINVITRQPDAPLAYQLQLDTGSHGDKRLPGNSLLDQRHVSAGFSASRAQFDGSFSLDIRDADGFDLDPSSYSFGGDRGSKINLVGTLGMKLDEYRRLEYSSSWYEEDVSRDFSTFTPGQGDILKLDAEYATRFNQTLSWRSELAGGRSLKAFLMSEQFEDTTRQDVVSTSLLDQKREANIETFKAEVQFDMPFGQNQQWTMGAALFDSRLQQQQERAEGSRFLQIDEIVPGADHQNGEFFVQNSVFAGEHWEFLPGLRWQQDSDFGSHVAPKINVLYVPQFLSSLNPRLRFGLGSGYRVPNLKERYFLFDHSANGYVVLGNTELEPEESDSLQLGFEMSASRTTRGEIAVFYNRFRNLITTSIDAEASAGQQLQVYRYSNVDAATTRGVELNLAQRLSDRLSVDAAYTWLLATDSATGLDLTRRPEHQVDIALNWTLPGLRSTASLKAAWQSHEYVDADNEIRSPGYATLGLRFNQPVGRRFKWFAGIDNLLDEHQDPDNAGQDFRPSEGRYIYSGLRYSL
ncbi:TonB-dependent receptor plug domain-containing protein [Granulosicoccus sp. 3-233]|uniref:TonB-dependent receptor plug domain-containing protein n=1 Tax=Granulosicoccus sp. 3-233 TaxID=3417969 RepID=UPI003D33A165